MKKVTFLAVIVSIATHAQIPKTFKPNDPVLSAEINQNFKYLDSLILLKANKTRLEVALEGFSSKADKSALDNLQTQLQKETENLWKKTAADSLILDGRIATTSTDLGKARGKLDSLAKVASAKVDTAALKKTQADLDSVRIKADFTYLKVSTLYDKKFNDLVPHPKSTTIGIASITENAPFPKVKDADWYNFINIRHFNGYENDGRLHGGQLAWGRSSYQDRLAFRSQSDGTWTPWTEVFTNKNLTAANLPGGPYIKESTALSVDTAGVVHMAALKVHSDIQTPDYVFAPDYKLSPLADVEAFTQANQHLPDVPSAAEIEKGGMDLAKMNLALLRKVEELTLHAIAQEKRIQSLETEIRTLR